MASAKEEEELLKYLKENPAVSRGIDDDDDDDDDELVGCTWEQALYNSLAILGVLSSLLAMSIEDSFAVSCVCVICMIVGPAAAIKETKLSNLEALKDMTKEMKGEAKKLESANKKLAKKNKKLKKGVERLKKLKESFDVITDQQGQSTEMLEKQLEEFKKIQEKIEANVETKVIQNLISVITTTDKDGDYEVDENEISQLVDRLNAIEGFTLNEKLFRQKWKKTDHSFGAVLEIVQNLMDANVPEKENIFKMSMKMSQRLFFKKEDSP